MNKYIVTQYVTIGKDFGENVLGNIEAESINDAVEQVKEQSPKKILNIFKLSSNNDYSLKYFEAKTKSNKKVVRAFRVVEKNYWNNVLRTSDPEQEQLKYMGWINF